jgi:hypothetical protein
MMGDVGGKRTKIDPWLHKAVRISGRQPLLNHASVQTPLFPVSNVDVHMIEKISFPIPAILFHTTEHCWTVFPLSHRFVMIRRPLTRAHTFRMPFLMQAVLKDEMNIS